MELFEWLEIHSASLQIDKHIKTFKKIQSYQITCRQAVPVFKRVDAQRIYMKSVEDIRIDDMPVEISPSSKMKWDSLFAFEKR